MPANFTIWKDGTSITLDDPPWSEGADLFGEEWGRGSVHRTLGGIVVQDFGVQDCDRRIRVSGIDALTPATVAQLDAAYREKDTVWNFTDGYDTFQVQFSRRPPGFRYWRCLKFSEVGVPYFSYELLFIVLSEVGS